MTLSDIGDRPQARHPADPYTTPQSELSESSKNGARAAEVIAVQEWERATSRRRIFNYFIDTVAVMGLGFPVGFVVFFVLALIGIDPTPSFEQVPDAVWGLGLTLLYYAVCEGVWGRTLGKLITGTMVLRQDGRPLGVPKALLRTVCRFIPFEALTFLQGERPSGLHDNLAKSAVVEVRLRQQTLSDLSKP